MTGSLDRVVVEPPRPVVAGIGDVLPVVIALIPFGFTIGSAVVSTGFDGFAGWLAGPGLVAGSAHLAVVTAVHAGSGPVVALMAAVVINLRFAAYGADMVSIFAQQPRWFRWIAPFALVDQLYALSVERPESHQPVWFRRYWGAMALPLILVWTSSITMGMAVGPVIPERWNMAYAAPLMFVALAAPSFRGQRSVRAGAAAALVALLLADLAAGLGIVLAITTGVVAGAVGTWDDE
ncbi:MAG: AzlC family ABC transporter permease [Actinobacteria bacterium]|nr:AzlC family ABC transporter permease [Actinomycetota bacterium]